MFTADEARRLDRLALADGPARPGEGVAGVRHVRTRGHGLEFHDHRPYQPGDDPRSIEWAVHARLQQLVVRVYAAEGHLRAHVLLDASASMGIGKPPKLDCARRLAAILAYVTLERRDAVGLTAFDGRVRSHVRVAPGRPQLFRIFDALSRIKSEGASSLDASLVRAAEHAKGPGLAIVLSDFFEPPRAGVDRPGIEGLTYLAHRGFVPAVFQILAPEDADPLVEDDVELVDVEQPGAPPLVVGPAAVAAYRAAVSARTTEIDAWCRASGFAFTRVWSSASFDDLVAACVGAGLLAGGA